MPTVTKDFVADFLAPINGTSDCVAAWGNLNTSLQTNPDVIMTVPAAPTTVNSTYVISSQSVRVGGGFPSGSKLVVQANGVTFRSDTTLVGYFLGGLDQINGVVGTSSARLETVNAGDTSATLKNLPDAGIFSIGRKVMISGLCLQAAGGGAPTNAQFFEYPVITNIVGKVISFDRVIANTYLSTWPVYDPGDASSLDQGGPATLYLQHPSWNIDIGYIGCTFDYGGGALLGQISAACRKFTATNVTVTSNTGGITPTNQEECLFQGVTIPQTIEVDKIVGLFTCNNSVIRKLQFQSPNNRMVSTGGLVTDLEGTPRIANIDGATLGTVIIGCVAHGKTEQFNVSNSTIGAILNRSAACRDTNIVSSWGTSYSGGVFTRPTNYGPVRWAVPGPDHIYMLTRLKLCDATFRVVSVTSTGHLWNDPAGTTSVVIDPPLPDFLFAGDVTIGAVPADSVTLINCTGCPEAVDLSQVGAHGLPLWSYTKRTYTGSAAPVGNPNYLGLSTAPPVPIWGKIVHVKVNVIQAYTGTSAPYLLANIINVLRALNPDFSVNNTFDPVIDLKTVGLRTITATTVTNDQAVNGGIGGLGADSNGLFGPPLAAGDIWFASEAQLTVSHNISGDPIGKWPIVSVEILADQIPVGAAAPSQSTFPSLRLHS